MKFLILFASLVSLASAYTSYMSLGGQALITNGRQTYGKGLPPSLNVVPLKTKVKPLPTFKPLQLTPIRKISAPAFRPIQSAVASFKPPKKYVAPQIVQTPDVVSVPQVIEPFVAQVEAPQEAVVSAAPQVFAVTQAAPRAVLAAQPQLIRASIEPQLIQPQLIQQAPVQQIAVQQPQQFIQQQAPQYVAVQPAPQEFVSIGQSYQAAAAPIQSYEPAQAYGAGGYGQGQQGLTYTAAVQTRYSIQTYDVPSTGGPAPNREIVIPANAQPIDISFHSQSSPISVRQVHIPGQPGPPQFSTHQEEPDHLKQEIIKPIIQEVREKIQPLRRVVQEVRPVQEQVNQILTRGRTVQTINVKPSAAVAAIAPTIVARPIATVAAAAPAVLESAALAGPVAQARTPIFVAIAQPNFLSQKPSLTQLTPPSQPLALTANVVEEPQFASVERTVQVAQVQELVDNLIKTK